MTTSKLEKRKLNNMFEGDKNRDASDKVRGFLFQDLVAIDSLLEEDTECVCLEFLEDVDVFKNNGTMKIIQAKYYPKTKPKMKDIAADLYYQYLRVQELNIDLEALPQLFVHRKEIINKPNYEAMKSFINLKRKKKPEALDDPYMWLKENIYILNKEGQKEQFFKERAYEESLSDFLIKFKIIKKDNINKYLEIIGEKLFNELSEQNLYNDEEQTKKIFIGLAISYIQKRYTIEEPDFDKVKVERVEFINYMKVNIQTQSDKHLIAYINSLVWEQYVDIIEEYSELDDKYVSLLNQIVKNTQEWLSKLLSTPEGQYQLLNTVSFKNYDRTKDFLQFGESKRFTEIIACSTGLQSILFYLWKIILDICREKENFSMDKDADMLNPQTYINTSIKDYICLKFTNDFAETSVLLPSVSSDQKERKYRSIGSRMDIVRPQKWYMSGFNRGRREYDYNVATIKDEEDDSVIDMKNDSYFIECMDCIKIDMGEWSSVEKCDECIFSKECKKGEE